MEKKSAPLKPLGDCGMRSFNTGLRYCGLPDIQRELKQSDDLVTLAREYGLDIYDHGRAYSAANEPVLVIYRDGKTATNAEYHAVFASDIAPWRSAYIIVAGWDALRSRASNTGEGEMVSRKAVLDAVRVFCEQYDSLGIRFTKLLHNAIRAVPATSPDVQAGPTVDDPALVEALAALAHEQWSGWMRYQFECMLPGGSYGLANGQMVMPRSAIDRWQRQMRASYLELPDSERESDRKEARRMIEVFRTVAAFSTQASVPVEGDKATSAAEEIVAAWLWHTPAEDRKRALSSIAHTINQHYVAADIGDKN